MLTEICCFRGMSVTLSLRRMIQRTRTEELALSVAHFHNLVRCKEDRSVRHDPPSKCVDTMILIKLQKRQADEVRYIAERL